MPARISAELASRAQEYAEKIAHALDYVGVLCVELFVLDGDKLIANELARVRTIQDTPRSKPAARANTSSRFAQWLDCP